MKKLSLILVCLILWGFSSAKADFIFVSGNVSGTWSADTVIVIDSVRIAPGETLTIMPGVEVLFWVYTKFTIDNGATLIAVGTEQDTILFDEYFAGNRWKGLRFYNASDSCRLEYCHLTHGRASGSGENARGGAIHCNNSSPTFRNCLINNCHANDDGGGIFLLGSSNPTISNCTINGNTTNDCGGGIGCYSLGAMIDSCTISGNRSNNGGGGIRINYSNPTISNSTISGNWTTEYSAHGGGIEIYQSNPTIIFNTITGNWTSENYAEGGGIICHVNSSPIISNNIINGNHTGDNQCDGGGIACFSNSNPTISNNTINGNWTGYRGNGGGIYCDNSSPDITGNTIGAIGSGNSAYYNGGGICCHNYSNPHISGNDIIGNASGTGSYGGAIHCDNSDPTISGNTMRGNTAGYGGGIHCRNGANPTIISNIITGNTINNNGGGIYCESSPDTIMFNEISLNTASGNGGGIYCSSAPDTIMFNEISRNTATNSGGGIYMLNISPTLDRNTIVDNISTSGGALYCNNSLPVVMNCIMWGNSPDQIYQVSGSNVQATFCDIEQIWPGIGNIRANPLFADPVNGDYHLTWANFPDPDSTRSPCIDAGSPMSPPDPDSTIADMGCYYFDQGAIPRPTIILSTDTLNFPETATGTQSALPLIIYNTGDTVLWVAGMNFGLPAIFSHNWNPNDSLIAVGDSLEVEITFSPRDITAYSDEMTIQNNDHPVRVRLIGAGISPLRVSLSPVNPPIVIPPQGGYFRFNIDMFNQSGSPQVLDLYFTVFLAGVGELPVRTFNNGTLPTTGFSFSSMQGVPPYAPAGTYIYTGYLGNLPWLIYHQDSFTFTKEGTDGDGRLGSPQDWPCTGGSFGDETAEGEIPDEFALLPPSPNPFNPSTAISFQLPSARDVKLTVYDVSGREVAVLVDGYQPAGYHKVTFEAGDLPSGVYFARLQAGDFQGVRKLLLVK